MAQQGEEDGEGQGAATGALSGNNGSPAPALEGDAKDTKGADGAPIPLRPHHLLCLLGFRGLGYTDAFTANMAAIAARLRRQGGEEVSLVIRSRADAICTPCPERRGQSCTKAELIAALDRRHAAALGLEEGARLSWGEGLARIRQNIDPGDLEELCQGCRWLPLGLCQSAVAGLRAKDGLA